MIDTASLTDDEFETITIESLSYTKDLYLEVLSVLDSREAVSNTRNRLGYYFQARGVDIGTAPAAAVSQIYLGDVL